jgi:hypothetical protein
VWRAPQVEAATVTVGDSPKLSVQSQIAYLVVRQDLNETEKMVIVYAPLSMRVRQLADEDIGSATHMLSALRKSPKRMTSLLGIPSKDAFVLLKPVNRTVTIPDSHPQRNPDAFGRQYRVRHCGFNRGLPFRRAVSTVFEDNTALLISCRGAG